MLLLSDLGSCPLIEGYNALTCEAGEEKLLGNICLSSMLDFTDSWLHVPGDTMGGSDDGAATGLHDVKSLTAQTSFSRCSCAFWQPILVSSGWWLA